MLCELVCNSESEEGVGANNLLNREAKKLLLLHKHHLQLLF